MIRNQAEWIAEYERLKALYIQVGPRDPHVVLRSQDGSEDVHSGGYFNSRLVIRDIPLLREASLDLLKLFAGNGKSDGLTINGVVGPQTGATKLAELLSQKIPAYTGEECFWASPAKSEKDEKKIMLFTDEEVKGLKHQSVLLCEDVLTSGKSVELAVRAVTKAGGMALPFVLVLVNRSGLKSVNGRQIIALIDYPMPKWVASECPLCKQGSKAVENPKENWALLHAV